MRHMSVPAYLLMGRRVVVRMHNRGLSYDRQGTKGAA